MHNYTYDTNMVLLHGSGFSSIGWVLN